MVFRSNHRFGILIQSKYQALPFVYAFSLLTTYGFVYLYILYNVHFACQLLMIKKLIIFFLFFFFIFYFYFVLREDKENHKHFYILNIMKLFI